MDSLSPKERQSYPTKRQKDNMQNRAFHWEKITFTVAFFIFVLHSFPLSFSFFFFFLKAGGWGGGRGWPGDISINLEYKEGRHPKFIMNRRGHRILQKLPVKSH